MSRQQILRILHIDVEGGFGGSSRSLLMYVIGIQRLQAKNYSSHVLCKTAGPIQLIYDKLGTSCEVFPHMLHRIPLVKYNFRNCITTVPKFLDIFRLHQKIVSCKPDIVHLNHAGLMLNGVLLKFSSFKGHIVIHSRVIWPQNAFSRFFTHLLLRSSDHVIAIAAPVRQAHIANGFPPDKISVIHNPSISSCTSDNSDQRDQSVCRISYFGTIGNLKGPDRLIELADVLEKREFPFDIRIFGAPPRRRSLTKKLDGELVSILERQKKASDLYHFLYEGHVADPESRIAASDFIVRPSRENDPWGRDVIETMSHGKVIIATGYFDGFVKNDSNGFIVGEWDVNRVADIIIDTWSNPRSYAKICKNAINFAKTEFALETAASKFIATLADLNKVK